MTPRYLGESTRCRADRRPIGDDEKSAGLFETRAVTGREVLAGTSFALTEGTAESGLAGLWGRGAVTRFDGREGDLTLDGEVESALLGADWARGRWAAGFALGHSRGEGGYRSPQGDGAVESTLTGVYPYGRYDVNDWLSLWGVVGYGTGSLTLTPAGKTPIETDMDLRLAALGGRSVLVEAPAGRRGWSLRRHRMPWSCRRRRMRCAGASAAVWRPRRPR